MKLPVDNSQVWFSSDLHIDHKNICTATSQWESGGTRNFDSLKSMNEEIIKNINSSVFQDHYLFLLGDHLFGEKDYDKLFEKINCNNIYCLAGNHDNRNKLKRAKNINFIGDYMLISANRQKIAISHYPMLSFDHMGRNSFMIYGHCHSSIARSKGQVADYYNNMKTLDVGVDNAFRIFKSYRPFNLKHDIEPYMANKNNISNIDHHCNI